MRFSTIEEEVAMMWMIWWWDAEACLVDVAGKAWPVPLVGVWKWLVYLLSL
ncbi:MAG TPA: hypothetical protein VIY29_07735 [Ktedonobacteraceae bacterium]